MIKLNNITKQYDGVIILDKASYQFPQKGIVCLVGASGSGKTTLLNLIAGFDNDYEGDIYVGDSVLKEMDEQSLCSYRRDNVGFVFQNYHLLPHYTTLQNVTIAARLSADQPEQVLARAKALLNTLGLAEKLDQKIEHLSGGEKQRTALARALLNDPQIILADEPTGALDHKTSTEIMKLLQEIAKERLVIIITHDRKICDYADEIISIREQKIQAELAVSRDEQVEIPLSSKPTKRVKMITHGAKSFAVNLKQYIAVSLAIAFGVLAFILSLSFSNISKLSITDFQEKNTAFNNGYIKLAENSQEVYKALLADKRVENIYHQYKLVDITLTLDDIEQGIAEKFPTAKAAESLSYGVMPRKNNAEIALSPSLAKKFTPNINSLLGKPVTLSYEGKTYTLAVSGIYNAGYDDFIISSDIEQQIYTGITADSYSLSYDVIKFEDITTVSDSLKAQNFSPIDATKEVSSLQATFTRLNGLFLTISLLILVIAIFISAVILIKLQNTRYREVGLLSALGFSRKQITTAIRMESLILSASTVVASLLLLVLCYIVSVIFALPLAFSLLQATIVAVASFVIITLLNHIAVHRLLTATPAVALQKG